MPRSRASALGLGPALLALALAAPAGAAPYSPDPLTVSGRFEAPRAVEGPLKAGIRVNGATVGATEANLLGAAPDKVQPALKGAVEASLRNFGYLAAADGPGGVALDITLDPFEVTSDAEGVFVVARYRIAAKGEGAACVPTVAEARYHALAQMQHKGPQRAAAWVVVIGMAAVGVNAGQYLSDQYATARASDRAVNARRERSESEGVAPAPGEKVMTRYAAVNATQLAAADLIRQLGKGACAGAPASPIVAVAAPAS
jgi:hypothetical protein